MNLTKTRIWGSPLVPSPPPEGGENPPPAGEHRGSGERALELGATRAAPIEQLQQPAGEPSLRISPRSGTRIMNLATLLPRTRSKEQSAPPVAAEGVSARGATRILPIEQLTRALQGERDVEQELLRASEEQREAWSTEVAPARRAPKNVLRLVCVALAAVCIVLWVAAALVTPGAGPSGADSRSSAVADPAPLPTVLPTTNPDPALAASAPGSLSAATLADGVAELPRPTEQANDTRPRAAVDALVRGDEELARSLYDELARTRPEQPVFAEAARILRSRQAGEQ